MALQHASRLAMPIDLGEHSFENREKSIRVDSRYAVSLNWEPSGTPLYTSSRAINAFPLNLDHWIPRIQRLEVAFQVSFALELHLKGKEQLRLVEMLKQSLMFAELWSQLGLQVLPKKAVVQHSVDLVTFHFTLSLCDARKSSKPSKNVQHSVSDIDQINNFRPPNKIPSYQLASIQFFLHFAPIEEEACYQVKKKVVERRYTSPTWLRLTDAALRSALSSFSKSPPGIKTIMSQQRLSLAALAPSTFTSGYVDLLASRASLIEPIARILLDYRRKARPVSRHPDENNDSSRAINDPQNWRSEVEANLWTTMANVLNDVRSSRRLKLLEPSPIETGALSEDDFEDIAAPIAKSLMPVTSKHDVSHESMRHHSHVAYEASGLLMEIGTDRCTSTKARVVSESNHLLLDPWSSLVEPSTWFESHAASRKKSDKEDLIESLLEDLFDYEEVLDLDEMGEEETLLTDAEQLAYYRSTDSEMMLEPWDFEASSMLF